MDEKAYVNRNPLLGGVGGTHGYNPNCRCIGCAATRQKEAKKEHAVGCDCSDCCLDRIAARKEQEAAIAEHFADRPEEYVALFKEASEKRRQEEMEKGARLVEKAKEAGAALAHYANSRDRLLDSLIETNSYLIKLHEANKFNAQHLLELMRINTINHATIMKEIR